MTDNDNKPQQVNFVPDPVLTNTLCTSFNDLVGRKNPQDHASMLAAHVASVAVMMLENNDKETLKRLFAHTIDEANKQRNIRLQRMLKEGLITKQ